MVEKERKPDTGGAVICESVHFLGSPNRRIDGLCAPRAAPHLADQRNGDHADDPDFLPDPGEPGHYPRRAYRTEDVHAVPEKPGQSPFPL